MRVFFGSLSRRYAAHQGTRFALGGVDEKGELLRAPGVLISKDVFENWFGQATNGTGTLSTWLNIDSKRELNFFQDYMATLHAYLAHVPSEQYPKAGVIIRDDFVQLSSQLEKQALAFFEDDAFRLKLADLRQWNKYARSKTEARMNATHLLQRRQDILKLAGKS